MNPSSFVRETAQTRFRDLAPTGFTVFSGEQICLISLTQRRRLGGHISHEVPVNTVVVCSKSNREIFICLGFSRNVILIMDVGTSSVSPYYVFFRFLQNVVGAIPMRGDLSRSLDREHRPIHVIEMKNEEMSVTAQAVHSYLHRARLMWVFP